MRADEYQRQLDERRHFEDSVVWTAMHGFDEPPEWFPSDWQQILADDPEYQAWSASLTAKNQEIDEMPLIAKDSGGAEFEKLPEGVHMAVCDMVVNLGDQLTTYQGQSKVKPKVYIRFQVPAERVEINGEDKPMVAGSQYTLSLHENAALRSHLQSWRGKAFTPEELEGFDISKLLGVPCQINVVYNESGGKTYANIETIMALPKGAEKPVLEGEPVLYVNETETPGVLETLPQWMQKKIGEATPASPPPPAAAGNDFEDDIPF